MDSIKIGSFIQEKRKEKGLTQQQLADALYISDRAVSKWERGKSIPDASTMVPLCKILDISLTELFTGEEIEEERRPSVNEEALLQMKKEKEDGERRILKVEPFLLVPLMICFASIYALTIVYGCLHEEFYPYMWGILISDLLLFLTLCFGIAYLEYKAGSYHCPECGKEFDINFSTFLFAPHHGSKRKLTCPHCHKTSYCPKSVEVKKK